ncbi:MAG: hypothetical protein ACLTER_11070 [Ruminococcus sp.]
MGERISGFIMDEGGGYIRFYNIQQQCYLADLVRNDFINICSFKKYEKEQYDKIIDEFIKKDMMRYGKWLIFRAGTRLGKFYI